MHFLNLKKQHGVALLEVLIAVVVLSIGLLGVAALQTSALRNNQSSLERSLAVIQSYSILEAMRADVAVARAPTLGYNMALTSTPPTGGNLIQTSQRQWITDIQAALNDPGARGAINCNAGNVCTITITWNDSRGGVLENDGTTTGDAAQTFTTMGRI